MSYEKTLELQDVIFTDCQSNQFDFSTPPALALCSDICPASVLYDPALPIRLQQFSSIPSDTCTYIELDVLSTLLCSDNETADLCIGWRDGDVGYFKTAEQRKSTRAADDTSVVTLIPTSDYVILIDSSSGAVSIDLDPPSDCDPAIFHLKLTTVSNNDVLVTPTSGNIDGLASITFSATVGINFLSSMHIFFDGNDWWVL